jgi:hypothetical protein
MKDKVEDFVIGVGAYYMILSVAVTYPAFTIAYYLSYIIGCEGAIVVWLLLSAVWGILMYMGYYRIVVFALIMTFFPFLTILGEMFGG